MTDAELVELLNQMKATLIAVSTGGPRIQAVNGRYMQQFGEVEAALASRGLSNPVAFVDLWQWYGRWSQSDLPTYQSRRDLIGDMFDPLIKLLRTGKTISSEPTGWDRVDRTIDHARDRLSSARTEEHFQTVGLLCREALISLAQEVFDPLKHPTDPSVRVSHTDFKRMIEAYIAVELHGVRQTKLGVTLGQPWI